jgi:murein DD-endopeptidase MepM/ murein hydrolase activator NlpD
MHLTNPFLRCATGIAIDHIPFTYSEGKQSMISDQSALTIIPAPLFFSTLPSGDRECACFICFPANPSADADYILRWSITSPASPYLVTLGSRPITKREQERGRCWFSRSFSDQWQHAQMVIEVTMSHSSLVATQEIHLLQQTLSFGLPLIGTILVLSGHRPGEGHRAAWDIPSQQFGWDLLPLSEQGLGLLTSKLHPDLQASDFVGYGWPVVAPAAATVVQVVDGQPDILTNIGQVPPAMDIFRENPVLAAGNYVVLKHAEGIYSCLAHLRNGSLKVEVGQMVAANEQLAELGNSGFSSGPHLHFHFMNDADLLTAAPLPMALNIEGRVYAPVAGDMVTHRGS